MSIDVSNPKSSSASRPRLRRRSWLLVVPVLGALAAGGLAISTARAQALDGGAADGAGFMGRRLDHLLDKVGATASQRGQIHAIWDGLRPQLKSLRMQHAALHQQMVVALTGTSINPSDVEKLRQQSMALADKTSALFTQGVVASAQVLTPDQRKTAQQVIAERRGEHRFGPMGP